MLTNVVPLSPSFHVECSAPILQSLTRIPSIDTILDTHITIRKHPAVRIQHDSTEIHARWLVYQRSPPLHARSADRTIVCGLISFVDQRFHQLATRGNTFALSHHLTSQS